MNTQTIRLFFRNESLGLLLLRLSTGTLMIFHGIHKLVHGHDFIRFLLRNHHLPEFLAYGVPAGEIAAPLFIILGYQTRTAASLLAFTMAMSIYLFFGGNAFTTDQYGGLTSQLNLLFLFSALALVFLGPGKYSISERYLRDH